MSMPTELVIAIIVVQLGALVVQQQRLIGILRSHIVAQTRSSLYLAKLAALWRLAPPSDAEVAEAIATSSRPPDPPSSPPATQATAKR
jgi:hypothetical protein